ncbi:hypothetical protein C0J52_26243 [Blattella germanica]|nr:hypothetical protein C0J52_26243 [Blattella germanica]
MFHVVTTKRGNVSIVFRDFKLSKVKDGDLQDGTVKFSCTNRKCKVIIYTDSTHSKVLKLRGEHNHKPMDKKDIALEVVRTASIRKAEDDLETQPDILIRSIIESASQDVIENLQPRDMELLRQSVYRSRRKYKKTLPSAGLDQEEPGSSCAESQPEKLVCKPDLAEEDLGAESEEELEVCIMCFRCSSSFIVRAIFQNLKFFVNHN